VTINEFFLIIFFNTFWVGFELGVKVWVWIFVGVSVFTSILITKFQKFIQN